jgi:hypothetical protein
MAPLSLLNDAELDELLAGRPLEGRPDLAPLADMAAAVTARVRAEPAPVMGYELRRAMAAGSARPARRVQRRILDAVAATVAVFAVGAVSAAGALPSTLQNAVSNAGSVVGISVPRADEADDRARDAVAPHLGEAEDEGTEVKAAAPPDVTPGGARPADPGTPSDQDLAIPATPATPPEQGSGGAPATVPADERAGDPGAAGQDNADQGAANGDTGRETRPEGTGNPDVVIDDLVGSPKAKAR